MAIDLDEVSKIFATDYSNALYYFQKEYLRVQLAKHNGNVSRTAATIGLERCTLHRKIKKMNLKGSTQGLTPPKDL
jgi:transcriptional regulator of acetoin/glycerol metabolism